MVLFRVRGDGREICFVARQPRYTCLAVGSFDQPLTSVFSERLCYLTGRGGAAQRSGTEPHPVETQWFAARRGAWRVW